MILFVAYAVLVWYFAVKWRRRWPAFAAVVCGLAGVGVVGAAHWQLSRWSGGRIYLPILQGMLYPYGALVGAVGVYIACLPRTPVAHECRECSYDLRGLESRVPSAAAPVCPECGSADAKGVRAPGVGVIPVAPRGRDAPWFRPVPVTRARAASRRRPPGSAPAGPRSPSTEASPACPAPARE